MKVLHLSAGNLYGGVERIVAACAERRALETALHSSVAVCFDGRLAQVLRDLGAECTVLGDVRVSRPHTVLRARRKLSDLLMRTRPDVAICHSCWSFGLAAPVLRRQDVPAVAWIHDQLSGKSWVERWASLSKPSAVICNSRYTQPSVSAVFADVPTHVIYAPVAPTPAITAEQRCLLRDSLGAADRTCVVLMASRFERWKGHRDLIDAMSAIDAPWQIWIAGAPQRPEEETYAAELREFAAALGVADRVRCLDHRADVRTVMRAADIFCQPNTAPEPFGLVFVEALYAGLPVVTSRSGGAVEIVTEQCGVLLPPSDRVALRHALAALIGDEDRRARLGASGPSRAAQLCDPVARLTELSSVLSGVGAACH